MFNQFFILFNLSSGSCQSLLNGTKAANLCQELLDGLFVKVNQDNKVAFSSQVQPINERLVFFYLFCRKADIVHLNILS